MAQPGDVIENAATGERLVFLKTTAETGGKLLQFDFFLNPGTFTPRPHIHLDFDERVLVIAGQIRVWVAGKDRLLTAGEEAVFPMRLGHTFAVEGEGQAQIRVDVVPARDTEELFETVFGLYGDGKTDKHGHAALLQDALLARKHNSFAAGPPVPLQRLALALAAPLARLFGYRARYDKYSGPPP